MSITPGAIVREDCAKAVSSAGKALDGIFGSTLLVTGGTGFLGSWICETVAYLNDECKAGMKLHVVARDRDRFERNLGNLASRAYLDFIRCDVRSFAEMPKDVNYVVHAAANPDCRYHSSHPIETMTTIAEGTASVLRAADRASDLRMFLNVSSSAVYGEQPVDVPMIAEDFNGIPLAAAAKSPYAEAKRYAEALCAAARREARIPIATIRPFTFMGPFQSLDAPWALNNFMNDALRKRPIRILSDGRTVRGYMYGADAAVWALAILVGARSGQVYNVGSSEGIAMSDLAQKVAASASPKPDVMLNASITGVVPSSVLVPDTRAAEADFGLRRSIGVDSAIEHTMAWHLASPGAAEEY